jgi:hypothetical protein
MLKDDMQDRRIEPTLELLTKYGTAVLYCSAHYHAAAASFTK